MFLYSVGKGSTVMLHLAMKAFYPAAAFQFPSCGHDLEVQEMIEFRDRRMADLGLELIVHTNPEGLANGVGLAHGSARHTEIMKTEALKQALDAHKFDVAFGGARRDEEISRAKERVFSFGNQDHRWDPKSQRRNYGRCKTRARSPRASVSFHFQYGPRRMCGKPSWPRTSRSRTCILPDSVRLSNAKAH